MRSVEIEAVEERAQARIDVVEIADVAEVIEALLAEAAPEALHLALGGGVVRSRMEQRDPQSATRGAERLAPVGRAVIQVERVGLSVDAYRADEQSEHVVLTLGGMRFERDEVSGVVVEQAVDANRRALSREGERGSMADVALPERVGECRLPAKARLGALAVTERDAVEALLAQ